MAESATARRDAFIKGLRDMAEFLEQHPHVPAPIYITANHFVREKHDAKETLANIAKDSGAWEKIFDNQWFFLRKTFCEDLRFDVSVERERVCRKVVTGKTVLPAVPEREVENVSWVCDGGILGGAIETEETVF